MAELDKIMNKNFVLKSLERFIKWEPAKGESCESAITCAYFAVLIIAVLAVYMAANNVSQWFFFNADTLWMEDYLQDWFVQGLNMKSWMTPGAPNYFPEMLLYGLMRYATGDVFLGFVGFGLIKVIYYVVILYVLLSLITRISRVCRLRLALLYVTLMLLATILLGQQFNYIRMLDFWQLFIPTAHGGAICNALLAIFLTLLWLRQPYKSGVWLFLLFVLSIAASLSDRLYVVWFTFPALCAVFGLLILGRIKSWAVFWFSGVLFGADYIGRKLFAAIVPLQQVIYQLTTDGWRATLHFYSDLFTEGWYHPVILVSYICLFGVALKVFINALKSMPHQEHTQHRDNQEIAQLFLLPYAVFALPISFLAMAIMNRPETQYFTGGNLLALSFWGVLLVVNQVGRRIWIKGWFHVVVIVGLLMCFISWTTSPALPISKMLVQVNPYSKLVACLDSHSDDLGKGAGIADYWQARRINLFSKKGLRVHQAQGGGLKVFQWVSNSAMFDGREHTFVLTNTPTNLEVILEEDVIRINGNPDVKFVCDGFPVLVYKNGLKTTMPMN